MAAGDSSTAPSETFRELAELLPHLVWVATPDGKIEYFNQRWDDYTGTERDTVPSAGWSSALHMEDVESALAAWQDALASSTPLEVEFRLSDSAGEYRWFLARGLPQRNDHGAIERWFGTCTDIQVARRAQAEAERASRAKDEFLAALSHELRTPLTPVLMTAAMLVEDETLPPEIRSELRMIHRNVELEARLIDDLLDLTRITRGKLQLESSALDIHSLLRHTTEIVQTEVLTKRLEIDFFYDAAEHHVQGDATRLHQVLWNLLKNAIKFTPQDGRITVETSNPREGVLAISVRDSGIGIEPEFMPRVFKAFEQGEVGAQHRFGGLGLGLAISQAIVELHRGTIRVESEGRKKGATFTVELQSIAAPAEIDEPEAIRGDESTYAFRLLVVEDHAPTLSVLTRLLERYGHDVTPAGTFQGALALAGQEEFDLVISDLGLPDGSGIELMRSVSERFGLQGIALSGYGMEEDVARSREAGFLVHLVKPINFDRLREVLQQIGEERSRVAK